MRYIGGKHRQGKIIAGVLKKHTADAVYVEPFCGSLGVARHLAPHATHMMLSDVSASVIAMWENLSRLTEEQLQQLLPDTIDEEMYAAVRACPDNFPSWMEAYVAVGMSFGGKWWGGYARDAMGTGVSKSAPRLKRAVIQKCVDMQRCGQITWDSGSYDDIFIPDRAVLYCDPPYANKTVGYEQKTFDHDTFWSWCRYQVDRGVMLLATEFNAPEDFMILHAFGDTTVRHHQAATPKGSNNEVIICHESQLDLWTSKS